MRGTLYVVATPIGNLEDVTLRALRVLREVSLIAAEDTRRTARLLQHYSISTRTTSVHAHNERERIPDLLTRLEGGESIALVSDAGTPVVSDPGAGLVAAAHAAGLRVEPIPGPSAVLAALSASGMPCDGFVFLGFPPAKGTARTQWFAALARERRTAVAYEAPHRLHRTLADLLERLGDRKIAVARELTKAHEELVVRPISEFVSDGREPRGEYTLVIAAAELRDEVGQETYTTDELRVKFHTLTTQGLTPRLAVRTLADAHGITARQVYAIVHTEDRAAD